MAVNGAQLLVDLGLVVVVAAVATLVFHRLRQPLVIGYLVAGLLIGPHSPFLRLQSLDSVQTLAELGIVFLMFSIGLEFRLGRLARAGLPALGSALAQILFVVWATVAIGGLFGWRTSDALFMGAILAISSTVVAAKAIVASGKQASRWAELALAILIVEDVVAVAILAILGAGTTEGVGVVEVLGVLGRIATFALAALVLGLLAVPPLINRLVRARADEVLVVTLAGLALGVAVLALLLGFSPALGAFLIGAVVAEASEAWSAEQRVLPLRELFSAVFFVSVGMLFDPALLAQHWQPALLLGALLFAFRIFLYSGPAFLLGAPAKDSFRASMALVHIGEFSFVIAALGLSLGVVSDFVLPVTVVVAIASAFWTPYLVRSSDPLYEAVARRVPPGLAAWGTRYHRRLAAQPARRLAPEVRALARRTFFNAGAVAIILVATAEIAAAVAGLVTVRGLTDRTLALLPWLAGGVLALPFAFTAGRNAYALLLRTSPAARAAQRTETPRRRALRASLLVMGSSFLVFAAFVAAAPFLPPTPLLLLSLAAFMGAAIVLWETMARLQARVAAALEQALGGEAQGEERAAALQALQDEVRWGVQVERVRVEPGTTASVSTVAGLDLRARTGATLVGVVRRGHTVVNPPPQFVFEAGDALLLLGDEGQLERARLRVGAPAGDIHVHGEEPRFAQLRLDEGSPLAGRSLAEAALRERTGATTVAILRAGQRLASPGAGTRLEVGDVLLLVGSDEQVRAASLLARPPEAEPRGGDAVPGAG